MEKKSTKSKTIKKHEHHELQKLGEALLTISEDKLVSFELNEELFNAIKLGKKIRSHGALRRQKQLIGKLMKYEDPEPIRNKFYALNKDSNHEKEIFKHAEKWREILLSEGDKGLDKYNKLVSPENESITIVLHELESINQENRKTQLKRQLFKIIHKDLSAASDY